MTREQDERRCSQWRGSQAESRRRYLELFDEAEVEGYEYWVRQLNSEDHEACLADIARHFEFRPGMSVLDAGAGTGGLSTVLTRLPGLQLTALEPSPVMLSRFRAKPELADVCVVEGFCDASTDRPLFADASFDVIACRQLVNGLFDPLAAFQNWRHWLKPGGLVMVLEGFYERSSWSEKWQHDVDVLPLAASQSLATVPYLLEAAGLRVESLSYMEATNSRPLIRTRRYLVMASRPL